MAHTGRAIQSGESFEEDSGRSGCVAGTIAEPHGESVCLELLLTAERAVEKEAESESREWVRDPQEAHDRGRARLLGRMSEVNVGGLVSQDESQLVTRAPAELHKRLSDHDRLVWKGERVKRHLQYTTCHRSSDRVLRQ